MNENNFISRQISVYKTDKKLVEFIDKLNMAPIETYAHLHAQGDDIGDGKKVYSNIGIVMQDYSKGTGQNTVRVTANISPDEAQYIFSRVQLGVQSFEFKLDKIFGTPDENGYSTVTKLRVVRATVGPDGKERKYPWYLEIENGKGIAAKAKTGGTYCQSNSYQCISKVFVNLNDSDFFKLLNRVSQYIAAWELAVGPVLIKKGRLAMTENMNASSPSQQAV